MDIIHYSEGDPLYGTSMNMVILGLALSLVCVQATSDSQAKAAWKLLGAEAG